jgi:hypothetical protein
VMMTARGRLHGIQIYGARQVSRWHIILHVPGIGVDQYGC